MSITGFIYAIAAAITWGLVYVVEQKVLSHTTPLVFLFIGSIVTALITLPILVFQWDSVKEIISSGKATWQLIIVGEILFLIATFFIFSSVKSIGASLASSIEISYPFFVTFFTFLFFGGSMNVWFWLGSILIFSGSVIIIALA